MRPPGTGTKTKDGYVRVRVSYQDEFGRLKQKGFERKTLIAAQNAANVWLANNGRSVISIECGTLKELFERAEQPLWGSTSQAHKRSMKLYRSKWETALGDSRVDDITSPILTRAIQTMMAGQSRSGITKCAIAIRQALGYAVSDLGWIPSNPGDAMRLPKGSKTSKEYPAITREEYVRVLKLAEPRHQLLIRLIGECGMRPSEAAKVRPSHLFTQRDHWLVNIPGSKTEAGQRCIPISDELAREIEERAGEGWATVKDPVDHLRKWWRENSKTRMYDLRGWCSDEWRRKGVPDQVRHILLGHTEMKFSQRVYETLTGEDVLAMFGR